MWFLLYARNRVPRKRQAADVKIREEIELEVQDFEKARTLLKELGFNEKAHEKKHRTTYQLGNALVEIDQHPDIPAYLEIEAPTKDEIKPALEKLGYHISQAKTWGSYQVLKHYGKLPPDL